MAYTPLNLGDGISREPLGSALKKIDTMISELYTTIPEGDFSGVSQHIVPDTDLTYNLGSPTNRWHSLYVGSGSVYLGDAVISATTNGQVILPGVYDPTNHQAVEVYPEGGIGQEISWNAPENAFLIDQFTFLTLIAQTAPTPSGWVRAEYLATLNGEGYITGATVVDGGDGYVDSVEGDVATICTDFMYVYIDPYNIGDPNPLLDTDVNNWVQIPFAVRCQATDVNLSSTIGQSVNYADLIGKPDQDLNTTDNVAFNSLTIENIYAPVVTSFKITTSNEFEESYQFTFSEDGTFSAPGGVSIDATGSISNTNNNNELRLDNSGDLEVISYTNAVSIVSNLDGGGNYWTFNTDSSLSMPPGGTIVFDNGSLAVDGYTRTTNAPFAINVADTAGEISLNWGVSHGTYSNKVVLDQYGVTLTTNSSKTFLFDTAGTVALPTNSYIKSSKTDLSEGRVGWHEFVTSPSSVVGWGLYAQHDVYIQADNTSTKPTWVFKKNGTFQTPYFTFPASDGTNGQVLTTNGSGVLSWSSAAGGGTDISTASINDLADVTISSPTTGQVLKYNGSAWVNDTDATGGGGGGGTLSTRTTRSATTSSIADNASANVTITGFSSYALMSIQTSAAAWVTIYSTSAARTSDASRAITDDPTPGSGVLAEVITTGAQTQIFSPGVFGYNDETSPTTDIYVKVVNRSGSSAAITVTLKLLQLEA